MKQRIISSIIGLGILFVVLMFFDTILLNVALSVISVMALYELLHATGCTKNKLFSILVSAFAAAVPFFSVQLFTRNLMLICYLYVLALFSLLLATHNKLHIDQVAMGFMFSLLVPFSLTIFVYLRDRDGAVLGAFYALVILGSAWLSDTGAYFAGRTFGKHKLAPYISPKKTVEGAVGGLLFAEVTVSLVAFLYSLAVGALGSPIAINYKALLLVVPVLSLVSILGDLSASIIKRQYHVKDFGSIMPGHGGVMDRFDSALMVGPMVFLICMHLPLAQLLH